MNRMYSMGRRKEYRVIHEEKAKGNLALRSAGSHSPVDVVSVDTQAKVVRLIQCKPSSWSDKQKHKLEAEYAYLNGTYLVVFEVI